MIGAIIGDIVGSRFEWDNIKTKNFDLFHPDCHFTDDTVMTLAIAKAILESHPYLELEKNTIKYMQEMGGKYPDLDYGSSFCAWLFSSKPQPYYSYGNGAAMRVSPCGFAAKSWKESLQLAEYVTAVTHNHPEGIKGAKAVCDAIYKARTGTNLTLISRQISHIYYRMNFTLDSIRNNYDFDETCLGTVPQALEAFFESTSFEDAIRSAISIGGDSDTLAAITGSVAEAYYGVPTDIREKAESYLDDYLLPILREFESKYPWFNM